MSLPGTKYTVSQRQVNWLWRLSIRIEALFAKVLTSLKIRSLKATNLELVGSGR